jgi:hypothetical protein
MPASTTIARSASYAGRLLENGYLQENVRDGVADLRAAYARARRRSAAAAAQDRKLHRRLRRGVGSLAEAAVALKTGREKPKRRGRLLITLAAVGGVAAVVIRGRLSAEQNEGLAHAEPDPTTA